MNREEGAAHDTGDCLVGCAHPDHAFDGDPIDLGLFDDPEGFYVLGQYGYIREAAEEPVVL